MKFRKI